MRYDHHARDRARDLRRNKTAMEKKLWSQLRAHRHHGLKFRDQHPLGPYTADFYCAEANLVIEVDGEIHAEQVEHDARRDAWMHERGIVVLRFTNEMVDRQMGDVLKQIDLACSERINPAPLPIPLPDSRAEMKIAHVSGRGDQT